MRVSLRLFLVSIVWLQHASSFSSSPPAVLPSVAEKESSTYHHTNDDEHTPSVSVIDPLHGRFENTELGQVSIVSMNVLAPTYHFIGHEERESAAQRDRLSRLPLALDMAKQYNADILCLQEVEGGPNFEPLLKDWLADGGYDSMVYSALHPNRIDKDVVGLCVAWRSQRHRLISSESFRRGMVVEMEEIVSADNAHGARFCIGNVHLPAKPSAILGRLSSTATTIRKLQQASTACDISTTTAMDDESPLHGAVFLVGDMNCEPHSVTTHLIQRGSVSHGTHKDRNYRAKISKDVAARLRHSYRFQDVYAPGLRARVAPITVSLHGRGPGCMDQFFFDDASTTTTLQTTTRVKFSTSVEWNVSRRQARRMNAARRRQAPTPPVHRERRSRGGFLRVRSVLATITDDTERTQRIIEGLPNVEAGFPSDHLPIGALFESVLTKKKKQDDDHDNDKTTTTTPPQHSLRLPDELPDHVPTGGGAISASARRRRRSFVRSVAVRRRHNVLLRQVSDWLVQQLGATDLTLDESLHRWKWLECGGGVPGVNKKLRAPDLCCVLSKSRTLVVVEVTVAKKPDTVRREKLKKYQDLTRLLRSSSAVQDAGLTVADDTFVIVLQDDGLVPAATQRDLEQLAVIGLGEGEEKEKSAKEEAQLFVEHLLQMF